MTSYFIYFKVGNNVKFIRRERSEWQRSVAGLGARRSLPRLPQPSSGGNFEGCSSGVKRGCGGDKGHGGEGTGRAAWRLDRGGVGQGRDGEKRKLGMEGMGGEVKRRGAWRGEGG